MSGAFGDLAFGVGAFGVTPPPTLPTSPPTGDIRLIWNQTIGAADVNLIVPLLETGHDLETAVLISLFTDAQADPGDVVPFDLQKDPHGWWADTYETPDRIGSKLWQVMGRIRNQDTLNFAGDAAQKSLQWMIDDGVAASVSVTPSFFGGCGLRLDITITEPSGAATQFSYAWQQEA